jgi:enoyl-CoA hydratase/carnithine racemase
MTATTLTSLAATGDEHYAEGLALRRNGGVLTLTIDRPDDLNRLSPDVLARLGEIATHLRDDATTQVLVIEGAGNEHFSMGIMNPAIRASYTKDQIAALVRLANRTYDAIEALPQLVIAAINGKVLAGAVELSLACDLRYAASHATMKMPEAAWGGFPGAAGPVRLPMLVGRARALDLICTAREITAGEMKEYGIVEGLFPSETFRNEVNQIAQTIAGNGPLAIRGAKQIVNARLAPGFQHARELSMALRHSLEWSHDVDEGIAAAREGRKPRFVGR